MSFVSGIGDWVGSGKLDTAIADVTKLANTLGIKKPSTTQTQQVSAAVTDFNIGYATGTVKRYWPLLAIGGVIILFFFLRKRG